MENEPLQYRIIEDGIALAKLNNEAKLNSLSRGVVESLLDTFARVDADPEIRLLILTGTGRAFCAGADIRLMNHLHSLDDGYNFIAWVARTCTDLESMEKPVIAAVNGFALGGGAEICLAADIVIASNTATFGFPEATIGNVPGFGILRLAQIVGPQKAKELMMTGKPISAEEAQALGLVNRVVTPDTLMDEAIALAQQVIACSPTSIRLIKRGVNRQTGGEEVDYWVNSVGPLLLSDDAREGVQAFIDKRKPKFGRRVKR